MTNLRTAEEVAERLRCPVSTAYVRMREMDHVRAGKRILVSDEAIEKWIEEHTVPGVSRQDRIVLPPSRVRRPKPRRPVEEKTDGGLTHITQPRKWKTPRGT